MLIADRRYGKEGRGIWFLVPGPLIYSMAVIFFVYFLLSQDFSEATGALITFWICLIGVTHFLVGSIQVLMEAPKTAQKIQINGEIKVRFYFGREINIRFEDISSVVQHELSHWVNMASLLDYKKSNYLITLKNGTQIYVAGCLEGIDRFIDSLPDVSPRE